MKWDEYLKKKITVDEYYITYRGMQFKVRYVVHNGFTYIESVPEYNKKHLHADFAEWLDCRIDLNTRYDKPHWYKPLPLLNRDKKIIQWTINAIERAFAQYTQENVNAVRGV